MSPDPTSPSASTTPPLLDARRLRWLLGGLAVLLVAVVGWMFFRAAREESTAERWDRLARIRFDYEPNEDPFQPDVGGLFRKQRDAYGQQLEAFLEREAKGSEDALEPFVRWLIVENAKATLLSMRSVSDFQERRPYHEKAIAQLKILRDRFPSFPANWSNLAPTGHASTIRMLLDESEQALAHEEKHLPQPRPPSTDLTVLLRTDRGDLRLGLYSEDAPETVARFLEKVRAGRFDGTAFYERTDSGSGDGAQHALRGGDAATRDAKPFDRDAAMRFGKGEASERLLPGDSRNRIPLTRGVLAAWHPPATEYDETSEFLLVAKDSPGMNYAFTPIGKLLDDSSLATLDRMWAGPVWREEKSIVERTDETRNILDFLQAPVRIVKVLVYDKDGKILEGGAAPLPTKAAVEDDERSLATLRADRYKADPPKPPEKPAEAPKPPEDKPAGGE